MSCKSQTCLLHINSGSAVNGVSGQLMNQLRLPTEPIDKLYQVAWIDDATMTVSQKCRLTFLFRKSCKEFYDVLKMTVGQILLG